MGAINGVLKPQQATTRQKCGHPHQVDPLNQYQVTKSYPPSPNASSHIPWEKSAKPMTMTSAKVDQKTPRGYRVDLVVQVDVRGKIMATNTGKGYRQGSVRDRTQVQNPANGNWTKRDTDTGRFIEQKQDGEPFKGVAKEVDDRRK
ncbi:MULTISPECIES: hypothetical protein [Aeromonas]|uniref:hypothetical protein n=1 Tax=Aeromonas TaxID=642 RepID=UPI001FF09C67|nr:MULTISPECIES: hypothetical protein [Aeromonas]